MIRTHKQTSIRHYFNNHPLVGKITFLSIGTACLTPVISPPVALLFGLVIAQTVGNPYQHINHKLSQLLLQAAVVGLGFGTNLHSALRAGRQGIELTIASIATVMLLGFLLGKWLRIDKKTAHLISSGTAICGGSAIAAISPTINAGEKQTSVAMGCIFILNSIALFLFPVIGHALHLTQHQFGLWCAVAIHDTSSVVGAADRFGPEALAIATTVKLARALWIIPVSLLSAIAFKTGPGKIKIPYFIGLFIAAMLVNTCLPQFQPAYAMLTLLAKACLTLTLFLIGSGLSFKALAGIGLKPVLQSVILWITISVLSLLSILNMV